MRLQDCTGCHYCRKTIPHTKPVYLCSYGRYKDTPDGGFPCAWIKKCEYHDMLKNTENFNTSGGNVKSDDTRNTANYGESEN